MRLCARWRGGSSAVAAVDPGGKRTNSPSQGNSSVSSFSSSLLSGVIATNRARNDSKHPEFQRSYCFLTPFLVKEKTVKTFYIRPKVISSTMCSNSDNHILETWHRPAVSTFQSPRFRVSGCGNFRVHSCGSKLLIPHGNVVLRHSSEDWLTKITLIPQITQ